MPQPRRVDPRAPAGRIRYRKSVEGLTARQLDWLRQAFAEIHRFGLSDDRGFQYWAGLHGFPGNFCAHHRPGRPAPLFLPWHRAYLYFFELALADQRAGVSLPWWDWTKTRTRGDGLPRAFSLARTGRSTNSLAGAGVAPGHPAKRPGSPAHTERRPGPRASLPTGSDLEDALGRSDFYDFSERLEGIHDQVHGWVGGTMGSVAFAAYDPIFWAHHAMIDRVWRIWQQRHGRFGPSREDYDKALAPFAMRVEQTFDVQRMGYDYALSTSHADAPSR